MLSRSLTIKSLIIFLAVWLFCYLAVSEWGTSQPVTHILQSENKSLSCRIDHSMELITADELWYSSDIFSEGQRLKADDRIQAAAPNLFLHNTDAGTHFHFWRHFIGCVRRLNTLCSDSCSWPHQAVFFPLPPLPATTKTSFAAWLSVVEGLLAAACKLQFIELRSIDGVELGWSQWMVGQICILADWF